MTAIKKRKTRSRKNKASANIKVEMPTITKCDYCGEYRVAHCACAKCGTYRGMKIM